jgi:hypothetical protein
MIDVTTNKPLRVSGPEIPRPYIRVPESQLDAVHRLLESHGIRHWVLENVFSWDGGPFIGKIDLGRDADRQAVQAVLDSVP